MYSPFIFAALRQNTKVSNFYTSLIPLYFLFRFCSAMLALCESLSRFLLPLFVLIQKVESKNQDAAKACASTGLVDIACFVAEFMT